MGSENSLKTRQSYCKVGPFDIESYINRFENMRLIYSSAVNSNTTYLQLTVFTRTHVGACAHTIDQEIQAVEEASGLISCTKVIM